MLPLNTILEGKALEELLEREANKHEISIIDKYIGLCRKHWAEGNLGK